MNHIETNFPQTAKYLARIFNEALKYCIPLERSETKQQEELDKVASEYGQEFDKFWFRGRVNVEQNIIEGEVTKEGE